LESSSFKDVERDWMAIDRGEPVQQPVTNIFFESAEALSRVITKQRHILLQVLHVNGGVSISEGWLLSWEEITRMFIRM
jgi:predicted transcriptional regulator